MPPCRVTASTSAPASMCSVAAAGAEPRGRPAGTVPRLFSQTCWTVPLSQSVKRLTL